MKAPLASVLLGTLALAIATNSTGNDTSLSSSQRVEVRQVNVPFQPSPSDEQESEEEKTAAPKLDISRGSDSASEELAVDRSERLQRVNIKSSKASGNNTIDTAGTGHYGHFSETFLPVPVVYQVEPHHKPLKPSVVHRDPHAHFDTYDAIRTQDYDRHHQVYPSPEKDGRLEEIDLHGHGHAYGYGHGHENYDAPKAYHYDGHVIPECAHKNRYYYNLTFCLEDSHYPTETILWAIRQSGHYAEKLLSDVTYQSADNLVDGLTRAEEEGYTYQHYFGGSHHQHLHLDKYKPPYQGYSYSPEYYKKGGYICPSDIYYARPRRAMNTYGKWKVIVNLDYFPKELNPIEHEHGFGYQKQKHQTYTQTLRLEQCIYSNAPCSYIDSHVYSRCLQKHNFVRLVAWSYQQGIHVDTFKMPIACSCHIKQPVHFYQPVHHGHELPQHHGQELPQHHGHEPPQHYEHELRQLHVPQYILQ